MQSSRLSSASTSLLDRRIRGEDAWSSRIGLAGSLSGGLPIRAGSPEGLVELIEQFEPAGQASVIVGGSLEDSLQETLDAGCLRPSVLPVFEVDVVNDLRHLFQRGVAGANFAKKGLERAAISIVGEIGLRHVEADLTAALGFRSGIDQAKPRAGIDEAANHPGGGDPIDFHAAARHPGLSDQCCGLPLPSL